MISKNLEIAEYNDAGNLVATYITTASTSQNARAETPVDRVDIVVRTKFFLHENKLGSFPVIDLT